MAEAPSDSLFPFLRSRLAGREQMARLLERYKLDGLERLARSDQDYYDSHGHYVPELAILAHAALEALAWERDHLVCSNCGEDFEPGDWASTDCCSCDPVPASALPHLLKEARKEAEEALADV